MTKEKFNLLKVGDKIRYQTVVDSGGIVVGTISAMNPCNTKESCSVVHGNWLVTICRRQIICKIVRKKNINQEQAIKYMNEAIKIAESNLLEIEHKDIDLSKSKANYLSLWGDHLKLESVNEDLRTQNQKLTEELEQEKRRTTGYSTSQHLDIDRLKNVANDINNQRIKSENDNLSLKKELEKYEGLTMVGYSDYIIGTYDNTKYVTWSSPGMAGDNAHEVFIRPIK